MAEYDPHIVTVLRREFIQVIKDEKLILVPAEYGDFVYKQAQKQQSLLAKKSVSAFMVAKYGLLLNATTMRTVKNMVADGRIGKSEHFYSVAGTLMILTSALKRLRNE